MAGLLELTYQSMELEDAPGHTLTVYPAVPGSPSDEALKFLASWAVCCLSNSGNKPVFSTVFR